MKYEEPLAYTRSEIDIIEKSNDENQITKMLLGVAFNEIDFNFAFDICNKYTESTNPMLVKTALECISHLARIHGNLPRLRIIQIFDKLYNIKNDDIKWGLDILMDDIKVFIPSLYLDLKDYHDLE